MKIRNQMIINLISNIVAFVLQILISFGITSILTKELGTVAYGFVGLANNFINYASVFTIIINSMAGRFITYEITKGNLSEANKYYSSVFILNIIMSIVIAIFSTIIIINLSSLIKIPDALEIDVKLTFAASFFNLILSLFIAVFTVATYVKNRFDLSALINIVGNIIKTIFLIVVFICFNSKIYYIPVSSILFSFVLLISNINITNKIAPELKINFKNYNMKVVKKLLKSGIWNSINSFSKLLLNGFDLLIANLFVGPEAMGLLSISKIVPSLIEGLLSTMSNIFVPNFVVLYSKNKIKELVGEVEFSTKLIAFLMIVPITAFIVFGQDFFRLWLPNQTKGEIITIQILSVLSLLPYIFSANNYTLFTLDMTTNKLKRPVIITVLIGMLSMLSTIIILNKTNFGIYAIAGVSSILWSLKIIIFNNINAAVNLKEKISIFFKQFVKNFSCMLVIFIILFLLKNIIVIVTWKDFLVYMILICFLGYIFTFIILFNKKEKKHIIFNILKRLKKN